MDKCVIWTRVSTQYQEENGGSLDTQKEKCIEFAKKNGYEIVGYFGGTHESAKAPGAMIKEMKKTLKRDRSIKYVIVNEIDRYSRCAGQGITMFNEMLKCGVVIIEASSGLTTNDKNGRLMLGQKLLLAEWDNENRTDKFTEGRINCLKSGVYTGAVPLREKQK